MKKSKVKELLDELLENWLQSEEDIVEECCAGTNAIHQFERIEKTRIEYRQKIEDTLK